MEAIMINFLDLSYLYEVCETRMDYQLVLKLYNRKRCKSFMAVVFPQEDYQ